MTHKQWGKRVSQLIQLLKDFHFHVLPQVGPVLHIVGVPIEERFIAVSSYHSIPKKRGVMAMKEDVPYDFLMIVTNLALGRYIDGNMVEVVVGGRFVVHEKPKEGLDLVRVLDPSHKNKIFPLVLSLVSVPTEGVHTTSGENNIGRMVLNGFVFLSTILDKVETDNDVFDNRGELYGKSREIPRSISVKITNGGVMILVIKGTMDDASEASKVGNPGIFKEVDLVSFTYSPPNAF